jgi:hypothetical protein
MSGIEGICVSVPTTGLQGRQRSEFELRLGYSSGGTNLGVTDMNIGLGIWRVVGTAYIFCATGDLSRRSALSFSPGNNVKLIEEWKEQR